MKHTLSDYLNGDCSRKEYRSQFNNVQLEIDRVYVQHKGKWNETHYKILHINGPVAFAVSVYSKIGKNDVGAYDMFLIADGWRYNDIREDYRLSEEVAK